MKYDEEFDKYEASEVSGSGTGYGDLDKAELRDARLSRRERRKKRRLEEQLRRLEQKEGRHRGRADDSGGMSDNGRQTVEEEPRRKSKFASTMNALLTGNILSRSEVSRTYPYLLFVAFLAFIYIGNIFSMQKLHRQHTALTKEVRELRTKSMTFASQRMQATRQSNILDEIERRGIPLRESLTPNKVIPK